MVREPTDEEVRQFMQKYYPEWSNNIELGRILYKKFMQRSENKAGSLVEEVKISELEQYMGKQVKIKGIITDINVAEYVGCPKCYRSVKKGCEHIMTGQVNEEVIRRYEIEVSDDTGSVVAVSYPMNEQEWKECNGKISVGDVVSIMGKPKQWQNIIEFGFNALKGIEVVRKVDISQIRIDTNPILRDIYDTVKRLRRVKKQIYESMCRSKGVDPKVLIDLGHIIENGEYVEVNDSVK